MGTFFTALVKFRNLDLVKETAQAMETNHDLIVELNTVQLDKGELADETYLPSYSELTKRQKKAEGKQSDPMNLRDTNAFRGGFYLIISGNTYMIRSSDEKTSYLMETYTPAIFGLNKEQRRNAWQEFLRATVVKQIKAQWGII